MDDGYGIGFRQQPVWLLLVALILFGQAGLASHLFGTEDPWGVLVDSRPILDGRHPLHLYHGSLGAKIFRERLASNCYDPAFQAGYPKTPIFDAGARPAEVFLGIAGGRYEPAAYKLGLFACCLLAPLTMICAARGFGLDVSCSCLAGVGGCCLWWSQPIWTLLEAGQLDTLIAAQGALIMLAGMARYGADPGTTGWIMMAGASLVCWTVHPLVALGLIPIVAVYYLVTAPNHGLAWHLGLIAVPIVGITPNLWWLVDWVKFWWLRKPLKEPVLQDCPLLTVLGNLDDYFPMIGHDPLGWGITGLGFAGLLLMARRKLCVPALVLLSTALLATVAARLGTCLPVAQYCASDRAAILVPAVSLLGAIYLLGGLLREFQGTKVIVAMVGVLPAVLGWTGVVSPEVLMPGQSFQIGFTPHQKQIISTLQVVTNREARILLEEPDSTRPGWNWTCLLPLQTDRIFLGGLDPTASFEHNFCGLDQGKLLGRPLAAWSPRDRQNFCKQYNIGWVLCRTPETIEWWRSDPDARERTRIVDGSDDWVLFELDRKRSFTLAGSAKLERMDSNRIVLTDVVPNEAGEVILSLHYQPELRATPLVVIPAPSPDLHDPIPFLKLIVPGPVSRVNLSWEHP